MESFYKMRNKVNDHKSDVLCVPTHLDKNCEAICFIWDRQRTEIGQLLVMRQGRLVL